MTRFGFQVLAITALFAALASTGCSSKTWLLTWDGYPESWHHTHSECQSRLDRMVREKGWTKNSYCKHMDTRSRLGDTPVREY